MNESLLGAVVFYALAALTVGGAVFVAFSRNIVHSAFALLGTLVGAAGLYAYLAAELLVVLQVMVYVGGVLVLILFAVMLTSKISDAKISNPSVGRIPGLAILLVLTGSLVVVAVGLFGDVGRNDIVVGVSDIGDALLGPYLLPFQVASVLLLAVLIGAVGIARGVRPEDLDESAMPVEKDEDPREEVESTEAESSQGEAA